MLAKKNIAIGGICTECSSYSPLFQNKEDFITVRGQELLTLVDFPFSKYNINANIRAIYRSKYGLIDSNANGYLDNYDTFVDGYSIIDIFRKIGNHILINQ